MLMALQTRLYTVEDLEELGEDYELDRGVLVPLMPGYKDHGYICSELNVALGIFVKAGRLGRVYSNDTGFILERAPDTVRGPDVAFIRAERVEVGVEHGFHATGPDLAVEVVGSGSLAEAFRKASQYLQGGGRMVWVIDLPKRRAVVFHEDGEVHTLHEADSLDGGDVLPGFHLSLGELFEGL